MIVNNRRQKTMRCGPNEVRPPKIFGILRIFSKVLPRKLFGIAPVGSKFSKKFRDQIFGIQTFRDRDRDWILFSGSGSAKSRYFTGSGSGFPTLPSWRGITLRTHNKPSQLLLEGGNRCFLDPGDFRGRWFHFLRLRKHLSLSRKGGYPHTHCFCPWPPGKNFSLGADSRGGHFAQGERIFFGSTTL